MRLTPILACALLAGCATDPLQGFDNRGVIANDDKMLAFVGEKVAVAMLLEEGPEDPNVIVLDLAYAARYRVLEVVHGDYDREVIDFVAYDHYGTPAFSKRDVALLYVSEHEGALYHRKYQYDKVYPTADGRYAGCGDPYADLDDKDKIDRRPLERIEFNPPVVMKISEQYIPKNRRGDYTAEELEDDRRTVDAYFSPPAFDVKGDVATCRMGAYPDELFRIRNETIFLPRRREDLCVGILKLDPSRFYSDDSGEGRAIGACVADLKARGLP